MRIRFSIKMIQGNASGVMCGFDGKAAKEAGKRAVVTGNPVRKEIVLYHLLKKDTRAGRAG